MIARWCISIFIFSLTLFGVVSQQQAVLPNQEIVLQFAEVDLTLEDAQETITLLKKQLQDLGAENIQVNTFVNGSVNIAYYSNSDAASIKKILSEGSPLAFGLTTTDRQESTPKDSNEKNSEVYYNLDVFEIQNDDGQSGKLNGNLVLQIETKSDRFLEPNINLFCHQTVINNDAVLGKLAFSVCHNLAIAIKDTPHKIPEGRAGPFVS